MNVLIYDNYVKQQPQEDMWTQQENIIIRQEKLKLHWFDTFMDHVFHHSSLYFLKINR